MTCWFLYGQFESFDASDPYIWIRTRGFSFIVFAVSACFVIVLGLPAYFLLKHIKRVTWWTTVVSGFFIAATPVAIFLWPYGSPGSSASSNGVDTMINGVPTLAGWLDCRSYAHRRLQGRGRFLSAVSGPSYRRPPDPEHLRIQSITLLAWSV